MLFSICSNHVDRDFFAFRDVCARRASRAVAGWFNIDWNGNSEFNDDGFGYEISVGVPRS